MTQEEIIKGNTVIKAFFTADHIRGQFGRLLSVHEYKYHTSWDWLMPVVTKITAINIPNSETAINRMSDVFNALRRCNIKDLWISCVDFITWYSSQPVTESILKNKNKKYDN